MTRTSKGLGDLASLCEQLALVAPGCSLLTPSCRMQHVQALLLALAGAARGIEIGRLADGEPCATEIDSVIVSFAHASVVHSNIGGLGPDFAAPQTMRLSNVAISDGRVKLDSKPLL